MSTASPRNLHFQKKYKYILGKKNNTQKKHSIYQFPIFKIRFITEKDLYGRDKNKSRYNSGENISRLHNSNYSKPIIKINNHTLKYIKTTQLSNNIHLPFLLLSKQRRKR